MAGCGVGRPVVCSKQWLGGGLECSGVTTLLGPGYPPEANMTRTILRNELNCQSHRHHHHRLQQAVHSDNNGSFGSNTHVRGAISLHMPPGRTTVEDLIRVPSHGLSHAAGLQHGSPTTGDKAHTSPPTQGAFTHMLPLRSTGRRFLTHLPAHLEINHRPGLPTLLTHAVDECPGTLAPASDSRESRWRVLA